MKPVAAVLSFLLFTAPAFAQETPAPAGDIEVQDEGGDQLVDAAKQQVLGILQNAKDAKFENVAMMTDAEGKPVICGRVDRKNDEGYYANQRYFIVKDNTPRLFHREKWRDEWSKECGGLPAGVPELTEEQKRLQQLQKMKLNPAKPVEE